MLSVLATFRSSKALRCVLAIIFLVVASAPRAETVYREYGVGETTIGFNADASPPRTKVLKLSLVVIGPSNLGDVAYAHIRGCLEQALLVAASAFQAVPDPTTAARFQAAYTSFKVQVELCLKRSSVASQLRSQFDLGLTSRYVEVDGLHLQFHASSPNSLMYREVQTFLSEKVGGDVGKGVNNLLRLKGDLEGVNVNAQIKSPEVARVIDFNTKALQLAAQNAGRIRFREVERIGERLKGLQDWNAKGLALAKTTLKDFIDPSTLRRALPSSQQLEKELRSLVKQIAPRQLSIEPTALLAVNVNSSVVRDAAAELGAAGQRLVSEFAKSVESLPPSVKTAIPGAGILPGVTGFENDEHGVPRCAVIAGQRVCR